MCLGTFLAEASLRAQQGGDAAQEFQKILDHRGIVGNSPVAALAQLGLARAYALQGDTAKARTAYQDFFVLWKDADIPILKEAKAEYEEAQVSERKTFLAVPDHIVLPRPRFCYSLLGEIDAYLAEGRSICLGLGPFHFLGLMHGHWDLPLTFSSTEQAEAVNMGISIIIPAKKVLEVLYHPELVKMRKELDQKARAKNYPIADTAQQAKPFSISRLPYGR